MEYVSKCIHGRSILHGTVQSGNCPVALFVGKTSDGARRIETAQAVGFREGAVVMRQFRCLTNDRQQHENTCCRTKVYTDTEKEQAEQLRLRMKWLW